MNQRGEVNLLFVFMVAALAGVFVLSAMRLQRSFRLMEKRTELFLCVKETEGELKQYMKFMSRTNWGLKNLQRARILAAFVPGLQGIAAEGEKVKRALIFAQNMARFPFLKKVIALRSRGCPVDPRLLQTPFQLSGLGYKRGLDDTALLRKEKWSYHYVSLPFAIEVEWNAKDVEALKPLLVRKSWENAALLSSTLSSY